MKIDRKRYEKAKKDLPRLKASYEKAKEHVSAWEAAVEAEGEGISSVEIKDGQVCVQKILKRQNGVEDQRSSREVKPQPK